MMKKPIHLRNAIMITAGVLIALGLLLWLGLQVQPKSFSFYLEDTPPSPAMTPPLETLPLPTDLPAPVERFYQTLYGEEVPVIETAVIQGRGTMKPFMNIPIPARFVFVHTAGKDYRHYFEATWFGIPLLKVDEGYLDGESFFESPMGRYFDEQNANQGANLALWAEASWFPALWLTDRRVRWEPVDAYSALLYVPFEEKQENFIVRFNPHTNLIDQMEAMRYRDLGQGQPKILWIVRNEPSQPVAGTLIPSASSVMWLDQGEPWAYFNLEDLAYNVDVSSYIQQRGH
jgi:hypothetical protein